MKSSKTILWIIIAGTIILLPFIGRVPLFDWDEVNFAEAAREMIISHNFTQVTINYQPFWEKPPLFFWLQSGSMLIFGINEFASRFPDFLFGILSLILLYSWGKKIKNHTFGLLWMMCYGASLLPFAYSQSGIIDPVFNFFIFTGIYFGFQSLTGQGREQIKNALFSGICIGLSVLTKGPVGIILSYLTLFIFWILNFKKIKLNVLSVIILLFGTLLFPFLWFGTETITHGSFFMTEFLKYQVRLFSTEDAGHGGPFYYHFIILLIGMFPASVFAFGAIRKESEKTPDLFSFKQLMIILFLVVLIIFSIVKTKIVHYSSLAYYPVSFLAAYALYNIIIEKSKSYSKWYSWGLGIIGTLVGIVLTSIVLLLGKYKEWISCKLNDDFARQCLNAKVRWTVFDASLGILLILLIITAIIVIHHRKKITTGIIIIFVSTVLIAKIAFISIVPKVELYSQNAAIRFYKGLQNKDCYVEVIGFKSYTQYFYTSGKPLTDSRFYNKDSLLSGKIDKTAYFVAKINNFEGYKSKYGLEEMYSENGFVFLKREPK